MKHTILTFASAALLATTGLSANAAVTTSTGGDTVETGGPAGVNDFYAQGNDDGFAEFGITTFILNQSDFGGELASVDSASLKLTVNDRFFSTNGTFDILYTPDDTSDLTSGATDFDGLSFNSSLVGGVDASQFTTAPVVVGSGEYTFGTGGGGDQVTFNLDFSGTNLVDQINNGSEFQLLLAATEATTAATFSNAGNTFDPGDPELTVNGTLVPEPGSLALLGLGGLLIARRRRA